MITYEQSRLLILFHKMNAAMPFVHASCLADRLADFEASNDDDTLRLLSLFGQMDGVPHMRRFVKRVERFLADCWPVSFGEIGGVTATLSDVWPHLSWAIRVYLHYSWFWPQRANYWYQDLFDMIFARLWNYRIEMDKQFDAYLFELFQCNLVRCMRKHKVLNRGEFVFLLLRAIISEHHPA